MYVPLQARTKPFSRRPPIVVDLLPLCLRSRSQKVEGGGQPQITCWNLRLTLLVEDIFQVKQLWNLEGKIEQQPKFARQSRVSV